LKNNVNFIIIIIDICLKTKGGEKMIDVIIADDEEKVCVLIERSIRWKELQMQLVGVCNNGIDLYNAVIEKRPQILITDICMPGLDGIELIKKIREAGINCKIIIISGYRQFEYAQNALKYNVDDYLLKPIDEDELNNALQKIDLELKAKANGTIESSGVDTLRSHFMSNLVYKIKKRSLLNLEEINKEFATHFTQGCFQAVYIKIDAEAKNSDEITFYSVQKKIQDICIKCFEKLCSEVLISLSGSSVIIGINYEAEKSDSIKRSMKMILEQVGYALELFPTLTVTFGIGHAYESPEQLIISIDNAKDAVKYRIIQGRNRLLFWDELELSTDMGKGILSSEREHRLKQAFEICDSDMFLSCIHEFFSEIEELNPLTLFKSYNRVAELFFIVLENSYAKFEKNEYIRSEISFGMQNALTPDGLKNSVCIPICEAMEYLKESKKQQDNKPIRLAKQYVEKHYSDQIKLEDVANEVYLSPAYFSNIFKKETGQNFIDFITDYRIKAAKDLLRDSDLSINEIADKVGYGEQRYFSKLFKKSVGIKPTEYRKLYS